MEILFTMTVGKLNMLKHFELFHLKRKNTHINQSYLIFLVFVHTDFQYIFCMFLINYSGNTET